MVAYSFKHRFAEPIIAGTKGGTIRADRKRHARPGEELQLYEAMRTKHCKLIARKTCLAVDPIRLDFLADSVEIGALVIDGDALDLFAVFDGFPSWEVMARFWRLDRSRQEASPLFSGVHIRWLPLPEFGWHSAACPLFEIAEHDCAYDVSECNCGYEPRKPEAA